jgi:hypothetical protein
MPAHRTIIIQPIRGTRFAEDKDEARELRTSSVLPALAAGERVVLDFGEVDLCTQSFMHALISEAIRRLGEGAFDRLEFKNCTEAVRQVVLTVFDYSLAAVVDS